MQQPEGNKGKATSGGSPSVEISSLPTNMVALFQEFLASMAKKEEAAKGPSGQQGNVEIKDNEKVEGAETP
jgi:hypothetical protein